MTYATVDELRESLAGPGHSPEYAAKQLHAIPDFPVVDRAKFILGRVRDKAVLDVGASGPMHEAVARAAKVCWGIDRQAAPGVWGIDLDSDDFTLPPLEGLDVVVCGEVLEHLSNPGSFLKALKNTYPVPVVITVPNAFAAAGKRQLERGIENVNRDHVAWYSWHTLKVLVERVGYRPVEWAWYGGKPLTAEGIICVVEP